MYSEPIKTHIRCIVCSKKIRVIGDQASQRKYCSKSCQFKFVEDKRQERIRNGATEVGKTKKSCCICGTEFVQKCGTHKYCSDDCRAAGISEAIARQRVKRKKHTVQPADELTATIVNRPKKLPRGNYVYGWYNFDAHLPFYVGMGTGSRAWDNHQESCENRRTSRTRIVVYRTNLTEEGARLIESVLILVFLRLGAELTNQAITYQNKRDKPPLEI